MPRDPPPSPAPDACRRSGFLRYFGSEGFVGGYGPYSLLPQVSGPPNTSSHFRRRGVPTFACQELQRPDRLTTRAPTCPLPLRPSVAIVAPRLPGSVSTAGEIHPTGWPCAFATRVWTTWTAPASAAAIAAQPPHRRHACVPLADARPIAIASGAAIRLADSSPGFKSRLLCPRQRGPGLPNWLPRSR